MKAGFGITDEGALAEAFLDACVGEQDANGDHDAREALSWGGGSVALRAAGEVANAVRAARLAMVFSQLERRGVTAEEGAS